MGNQSSSPFNGERVQLSNSMVMKIEQVRKERKLKHDWTCPNCMKVYPKNSEFSQFQQHFKICITFADQVKPESGIRLNSSAVIRAGSKFAYQKNQEQNKWERKQKPAGQNMVDVTMFNALTIKKRDFDTKNKWFHLELDKKRISWDRGCQKVMIDKKNVLQSCMAQFERINLHKEVKVVFQGQKSNDAGGLLRQLMHLVIKQIFGPEQKVFKRADTDELSYKLNRCKKSQIAESKKILKFYGRLIGKCLMQKIPISAFMDRTIIRQLCGKEIELEDIFSYDSSMYRSWKSILQNSVEGCEFNFTLLEQDENGISYDYELVTNGANTSVTDDNKQQFIQRCIKYTCYQRVKEMMDSLREGLCSVVPTDLLTIFQPHELQMVLYGVPFIDVEDWQINTDYVGAYYRDHKNIKWFWNLINSQPQQKLARLLHFCTGSTRVPINGFAKLETNRGDCSKFVIQSIEYDKVNPYPKGHTCFNRLELPVYPSNELLHKYVGFVLDANWEGVFGLD